ncbi:MAG: hypothetical protein A3G34_17425 [Candidatus Lindowbacteria bacterium RIFCSPLOWO2_12_FULL_62_27]|nr:MAG: hypothetical protein A3G34_17425 [Candidatus Lindowbacteria bacterium RIFCSPLOWO2_12_FULL_62_27]OGH62176.1 MAG: hypothetical protein A3I06_01315 [Candidatus Lindowbacteria bacterium RIFCSPLOWO2_02_FULL_62_12]
MRSTLEVVSRFLESRAAGEMTHTPAPAGATFRETRVYTLDFSGDERSLRAFLLDALVDGVGEIAHFSDRPYFEGDARVDIRLKPNMLDLERESILNYYRAAAPEKFRLNDLRIARRFYVRAVPAAAEFLERFRRDAANPVIHEWCVSHA